MKTPRIEDFDPNAKQLPSLKSPLDHFPIIQKPPSLNREQKETAIFTEQPPVPPYPVPDGEPRTPVPQERRKMKQRHPFDIYEDQYETLKQIAREDVNKGLPGSMSAMVRKGIDMYLEERKRGQI